MVLRWFFILAGVVVVSGAVAQEAPCEHVACRASPAFGAACRVYLDAADGDVTLHRSVLGGRVGGVSRAVPEGCYRADRVYGLQGWRFNTRGGHKIRHVKFLQRVGSLSFALADHDGDDFADGFVWLVPLPDGTVLRHVRAECTGACRLELAPKAAGEVVVLAGFDIRRAENDGHVRRFAVGPVIGTATAPEMRVDFRDDDFAYSVEVQYAYLPPGAVAGTGDVAQSYARNDGGFGTAVVRNPSFPDPALRAETGEGDLVLQFFAFAFGNGGHFLEDIGVERRMGEYEAWFQDNQGRGERRHPDDPFDWRAGFVRLRQGLRRRRAPAAGRWPSRPARARSRDSRRWRSASPAGPSPSGSAWRTPPSSSR